MSRHGAPHLTSLSSPQQTEDQGESDYNQNHKFDMRKFLLLFCSVLLLGTAHINPAAATTDHITIDLPQQVLAKAISAAMPLEYPAKSKTLQGTITLKNITDLKIVQDHIICRLHLTGNNMQIVTELAGHKINLDVGSVDLDFNTKAKLRFDAAKQALYITPVIDKVNSSNDAGGGDIGNALVALVNGRELPIDLSKIDPIVAETGVRKIIITTRITDIKAKKERLQLLLNPLFTAK